MNDRWYFADQGKGYGPFSLQQLSLLLGCGLIRPLDLIWREEAGEANYAEDIEKLLGRGKVAGGEPHRGEGLLRALEVCGLALVVGVLVYAGVFLMNTRTPAREIVKAAQPERPAPGPVVPPTDRVQVPAAKPGEIPQPVPVTPPPAPEPEKVAPAGAIEPGNVALAAKGATVEGPYKGVEFLLDGVSNDNNKYAKAHLHVPCVVSLPRVYSLSVIRFKLWDGGDRYYRYKLEASADGRVYDVIADRTAGEWRGWQRHAFPSRPVKTIRLTGTFNSQTGSSTGIHIIEFEAYCTPPDAPPPAPAKR